MFKKILVINLGGIGDLLLSTPALRSLKESFPQANLYLLTVSRVHELASNLAYVDEAPVFDISLSPKKIYNNLKVLCALRKRKIDLAINMRTIVSKLSALKIRFLFLIIGPKVKVGRNTMGRGLFFDVSTLETDVGEKQEMEYDIETVEALGIKVKDKKIDLKIEEESYNSIKRILSDSGLNGSGTIIGIHSGGAYPARRWPIEYFARVIDNINKAIDCKFVITGSRDEIAESRKLERLVTAKLINLTGRLSFKDMCAFISVCSIFISNDTGPMHIAAALKTPLVAIFGPGDLTRFDPRKISQKAVVLYKKQSCAPCNKITCNSMECLRAIFPEEVTKATLNLLGLHSERG